MSRIGKILGDLLPKTKKARELLTRYHRQDPKVFDTHVADTVAGRLRGFQQEASGPVIFRGVPFATSKRLEAPGPVVPWKGEQSCLRFGPACPQPAFGMRMYEGESMAAAVIENIFPPLPPDQSYWYGDMAEDQCLNANIFTPSLDGKRPVLVWIHGGAFMVGSNVEGGMFDASRLAADQDVVVVTINYRVGPFGFLHFPDEGITNLGIRDQIAGLEWVRDNASKFGGDASNVTILGESAGGMSVGTLIGSPQARGLFQRAIPMSGATCHSHSVRQWKNFFGTVDAALTSDAGGALTPASLKKIPADKLAAFVGKSMMKPPSKALGSDGMLWQPYRDGEVVPKDGAHSNLADAVPILTGVVDNEFKLFERLRPPAKSKDKVLANMVDALRGYFHWTSKDEQSGDAEKWKRHATSTYDLVESCRAKRGLPVAPADISGATNNMLMFEEPNFCLARDTGAFSYNLHFWDDAHFRDVPLLFRFKGGGGEEVESHEQRSPSQEDQARATQFQSALTSFARTGKPSVDGVEWGPYPEIMHLKASPEARAFKDELLGFQEVKRGIVTDLGIDTVLPQNIAA